MDRVRDIDGQKDRHADSEKYTDGQSERAIESGNGVKWCWCCKVLRATQVGFVFVYYENGTLEMQRYQQHSAHAPLSTSQHSGWLRLAQHAAAHASLSTCTTQHAQTLSSKHSVSSSTALTKHTTGHHSALQHIQHATSHQSASRITPRYYLKRSVADHNWNNATFLQLECA